MIVILKENPDQAQLDSLLMWLKEQHVDVHPTIGAHHTILGLIGDTSKIDIDLISALDIVEDVKRVRTRLEDEKNKYVKQQADDIKVIKDKLEKLGL